MASKHLKTNTAAEKPAPSAQTGGKHTAARSSPPKTAEPARKAPSHAAPAKEKSPSKKPAKKANVPAEASAHNVSRESFPGSAGSSPAAEALREELVAAAVAQRMSSPTKASPPAPVPEPQPKPAPAPKKAPKPKKKSEPKPQPKPRSEAEPKPESTVSFPISTARMPDENTAPPPQPDKKSKKHRRKKNDAAEDETDFQRVDPEPHKLTGREIRMICILLIVVLVLAAAAALLWYHRDIFSSDNFVLSLTAVQTADEEYTFDAGSGQEFAPVGSGLAIATAGGVELLDKDGNTAANLTVQIDSTAIAACDDFAVFYDLDGTKLVQAGLDGTVQEFTAPGSIISVTVSDTGYITVTSDATGYRALVTVYDSSLNEVYEWYSSSAWIMSGMVSPDGRTLAVLCYTMSGSEIRFFRLSQEDQTAVFPLEQTLLLDFSWLGNDRLCAYSNDAAYFFNASGTLGETYSFDDLYLNGCSFGGEGFVVFALSQYRSGTTATLVSLDARGELLGTTDITGELVSLTAAGTEILVLCPTEVTLYNSSLEEKGNIPGITGFKYASIRSRGEALLIASNYAEVYTF